MITQATAYNIYIHRQREDVICPLTGSSGSVRAQVITVEMRMNIFDAGKCSICLWRAVNTSVSASSFRILHLYMLFQQLLVCLLGFLSATCLLLHVLSETVHHCWTPSFTVHLYFIKGRALSPETAQRASSTWAPCSRVL